MRRDKDVEWQQRSQARLESVMLWFMVCALNPWATREPCYQSNYLDFIAHPVVKQLRALQKKCLGLQQ